MIKQVFIILFLLSLSFAATGWIAPTVVALIAAVTLLAILFMFGYALHNDEIKMVSKEELYQLVTIAIIIGSLVGITEALDSISSNISGENLSFPALALSYVNDDAAVVEAGYNNIVSFSSKVGLESSKSLSCSYLSLFTGFSACGSYSTLLGTFSLVFQGMGIALAEWGSMKFLLGFAETQAFGMLIPFGLFLRVFRFTRGAGAIVIGLAVALYVFLPMGIFLMHNILAEFENSHPNFQSGGPLAGAFSVSGCDAYTMYDDSNVNSAKSTYNSAKDRFDYYAYLVLVKTTMTVVISMIVMLAGLRYVSTLAGAEVDVSILTRIA